MAPPMSRSLRVAALAALAVLLLLSAVAGSATNCGVDVNDAFSVCHQACPGGVDAQCPPGMRCFALDLAGGGGLTCGW
jgi:hypothetical protein